MFGSYYPPPFAPCSHPCILGQATDLFLIHFLEENPAAYLDKLQLVLHKHLNIYARIATIFCALKHLNITGKTLARTAAKCNPLL
jgi:hypothetical protein